MKNTPKSNHKKKTVINDIQEKIIENIVRRPNNMTIEIINQVSGAIMSTLVDKMSKKVSADEIGNLYSSLEFMIENERKQEAFSMLHIIIKTSGVRLPEEYRCIVDNEKLRADFVEEAVADLEDILYDLE
jgi:hypothetical protein